MDRQLAGRYRLIEPLGEGGMGVVRRAHDELPDRPVAVKVVRCTGVSDQQWAAHATGVLHRDVKPENMLLADDGRRFSRHAHDGHAIGVIIAGVEEFEPRRPARTRGRAGGARRWTCCTSAWWTRLGGTARAGGCRGGLH